VKSRGSQCNETLLVRAAVRPTGQKARSSVCCEKLAVTAMPVLTPYSTGVEWKDRMEESKGRQRLKYLDSLCAFSSVAAERVNCAPLLMTRCTDLHPCFQKYHGITPRTPYLEMGQAPPRTLPLASVHRPNFFQSFRDRCFSWHGPVDQAVTSCVQSVGRVAGLCVRLSVSSVCSCQTPVGTSTRSLTRSSERSP